MQHTYRQPPSGSSPAPPSPQSKIILQREYREKEGECFNTLRDIIKELTGEELRTRQEILRKVISICLVALETRRQCSAQVGALVSYETHTPFRDEDTTSAYVGYVTQARHPPQIWQPQASAEYYGVHVHDQQYHTMSNMDPTTSLGYGGHSSDPAYPPFL